MKIRLLTTFTILSFTINTFSQVEKHSDEKGEHHVHHKNEIGIANSPVYFVKEKVFSYSLHIHYIRYISDSKFGIGLSYERIFDEHKHSTYGIVGTYSPIERLSFNISPGLTFEADNPDGSFALHLECSYEFEFHDFHLGPALEVAYDPEDYHISLGLHIGYGF